MKYEVTLRMIFKSSNDADHIAKQIESVFEFGTVSEAIVDGLKLNETPHLADASVRRLARLRCRERQLRRGILRSSLRSER